MNPALPALDAEAPTLPGAVSRWQKDATVALVGAPLILLWESSGLDLTLARWAGGPGGFPLQNEGLFVATLHSGARGLGWLVLLALMVAVLRPFGALRRLPRGDRLRLVLVPLLAVLAVGAIKRESGASCPWDMADFGGPAQHLGHWLTFAQGDGGPGHCFPAGHATTGFGFIAGWFVWRRHDAAIARRWLAVALVAGLLLGLAQQWRGAHFMSHTLWTAWLCFALGALADRVSIRRASRPPALNTPWA